MRPGTVILIVLAVACVMYGLENARLTKQLDAAREQIARLTITRPAMKCQKYAEAVHADTAITEACAGTVYRF